MASVTVNLTGFSEFVDSIAWTDDADIGSTFSLNGTNQVLDFVQLNFAGGVPGTFHISINGIDQRFTSAFEATGRILLEATDGSVLEVAIADADMSEPYAWIPTNSAEVILFANNVRRLTGQDVTLTLTDDPPPLNSPPSFVAASGNDQQWIVDTAIAEITVPVAAGDPAPTYAVVGVLPAGINFNTGTRIISGIPSELGSGAIRIRATNSEGTADWTVAYTAVTPLALANFDDEGLEVIAAALLVASAPGTSGSTPYADSDRGGTDAPLDGELGLGDSETVISRISHLSGGVLRLNDNDNPSALNIGDYFDTGGDGNDLILYLQTLDDGLVSFAIADNLTGGRSAGVVRLSLPSAGVALLNNIATGDRWIFALARIPTEDSEWSVVASGLETADSEWSPIISGLETADSEWSPIISGLETTDGEWSIIITRDPPSLDGEWSTLTGGTGRTGVGFLATPSAPINLMGIDQSIGSYEADISWAGQANHVYLEQVRTRWVARVDKGNGPAPDKATADAWAESTNRVVVGAFQYIDVISRNPSPALFGPVVLFDQMLNNPNFADATLWVMARLEVDDALKDGAPAPGTFSPFYVLTQRDSSQTVFSLFRGSDDEWCVGQMALQPSPSWEVAVTVAGIQDLYVIPFQYQVATESIDLVLTTVVAQFGFILHAVNFVSDGNILLRRTWNSPPEFPAGQFGPFVITNTDTTLTVDPILNCP